MPTLARISHQVACRCRKHICCQYVMVICSLYRHYRLRLMRSLRPSLDATLRAAIAVQIGCPADLSRLSFCRQRARVHCAHPCAQPCGRLSPCKLSVLTICPSTIATVMLSVPVSSTGQAPAPAGGTNLSGAELDVRRTPAGCAPWKAHIKNPTRSSHHLVRNPGYCSLRSLGVYAFFCAV